MILLTWSYLGDVAAALADNLRNLLLPAPTTPVPDLSNVRFVARFDSKPYKSWGEFWHFGSSHNGGNLASCSRELCAHLFYLHLPASVCLLRHIR